MIDFKPGSEGDSISKRSKPSLRQRWRNFSWNARAFLLALVVHIALFALIGLQLNWSKPKVMDDGDGGSLIQATVLNEADIQQAAEALEQEEMDQQRLEEEKRKKAEEELAVLEKKKQEEAERIKTLEAQRQKEEKKKIEAEQARKLEEKKREEAEIKRKEAEQKAKEEAERKAKEEAERKAKEEAEQKAKEEAERKAKEEAERKAKEEAERKAKAEAEKQAKAEAALKAQIAKEQLMRTRAGELGAARNAIEAAIRREFRQQIDWVGLQVTYRIRMAANGEVLHVEFDRGSGNAFMDDEAHRAILKASPLPVRLTGVHPETYLLEFSPQ